MLICTPSLEARSSEGDCGGPLRSQVPAEARASVGWLAASMSMWRPLPQTNRAAPTKITQYSLWVGGIFDRGRPDPRAL
jgi:hypothetical protein